MSLSLSKRSHGLCIRKHILGIAIRLEYENGDTKYNIPGFSYSIFSACGSPVTGEEYRAISANSRDILGVANSCNNLTRFLDKIM